MEAKFIIVKRKYRPFYLITVGVIALSVIALISSLVISKNNEAMRIVSMISLGLILAFALAYKLYSTTHKNFIANGEITLSEMSINVTQNGEILSFDTDKIDAIYFTLFGHEHEEYTQRNGFNFATKPGHMNFIEFACVGKVFRYEIFIKNLAHRRKLFEFAQYCEGIIDNFTFENKNGPNFIYKNEDYEKSIFSF
ncbi:MAG: hypothetical protein JXR53_03285 [Bacteroidales bacterium]|nr:hypothetical protein [Bacteroidales bacterium]